MGDASGNGLVQTNDVTLIQRVAARSDTGFAAQPLIDPLLIADLNRDGRITATDAALALRLAQQRAQQGHAALSSLAAPLPTGSGDTVSTAAGSPMADQPTARSATAGQTDAPAPVVRISGALDFCLNAPLPSSTWVNDWVAGARQTAPNDWKLTI